MKRRNRELSMGRILEAAVEVFAADGPKAARVADICQRANLNKRMLYRYFGSKAGLYEEVVKVVYRQFLALEVSLGAMLLPAEKLLETLVRSYYRYLDEHPNFVRLISYENLNNGQVARNLNLAGQKAPVITALRLGLEKGQNEGRFRPKIDVTQLLISIFSLCFFYFANHHTMEEFLETDVMEYGKIEDRIQHVVDLLLHGIATEAVGVKAQAGAVQ